MLLEYGLGYVVGLLHDRDVETVSRRANVSSRSRLGQNPQRLGLVSVSEQYVSVSAQ